MDNTDYDKQVGELFEKDFFIKLKKYIFENKYNIDLTSKYLTNLKNKKLDILHLKHLLNPDYRNIEIYKFKDFLEVCNTNNIFAYNIITKLLKIVYLLKKIDSNKISSKFFEIKLNSSLIENLYDNDILNNLCKHKLINLFNDYIENNKFIKFKDKSNINSTKIEIIFFILDYILKYSEKLFITLEKDIRNLFDIYNLESKWELNDTIINKNSQLTKELIKKTKQQCHIKYNKSSGRKNKNHGLVNSINNEELISNLENAKNIIKCHKTKIKNICKIQNNTIAKQKFNNYVEFLDWESKILLEIYFEENYGLKKNASVEFCAYKAMNDKFALDFFNDSDENSSFDAMKKYLQRAKPAKVADFKKANFKLYDDDFSNFLEIITELAFYKCIPQIVPVIH